jgi:hypothetical protein
VRGTDALSLGRIVGPDFTITIESGENGPVYSVLTKDGDEVGVDLTLAELRERHPDLAQALDGMIADDGTLRSKMTSLSCSD